MGASDWSYRGAAGARRYHRLVAAFVFALVSFALLLAVGIAFWWQEQQRPHDREVIYGVEDALDFILPKLSPPTREHLSRTDVRRILEWELRYLQDPSLRDRPDAVVGGFEAARYAQEQAMVQGHAYDGAAIIEVLDLQALYLSTLGAVGEPVAADEARRVLDDTDDAV
jgi:hypothetical protein